MLQAVRLFQVNMAMLAELHPTFISLPGQQFYEQASELINDPTSVDRYRAEALYIQSQGLMGGLHDDPLKIQTSSPYSEPPKLDIRDLTADKFLSLLAAGAFPAQARNSETAKLARIAFLRGADMVFQHQALPRYIEATGTYWAKLMADALKSEPIDDFEKRSLSMGRECAKQLRKQWKLGVAAGLPSYELSLSTHKRDIPSTILAKGWLVGRIEWLLVRGNPGGRFLARTHSSIISGALQKGDLEYVSRSVTAQTEDMPTMAEHPNEPSTKIDRLRLRGQWPSPKRFRQIFTAELATTKKKLHRAFKQTFAALANEGDPINYARLASQAHRLHCLELGPQQVRPSKKFFLEQVIGDERDEDLIAWLRKHAPFNEAKLHTSFEVALIQLNREGFLRSATPEIVALRAYELYREGMGPEILRPSEQRFIALVSGENPDPELVALLARHGVKKKKEND